MHPRYLLAFCASLCCLTASAQQPEPHPCHHIGDAAFKNYEQLESSGVAAFKAKNYTEAIKSFETAATLCDRSQSLIFALGRAYQLTNDCQRATTQYKKALNLNGKKLDDIRNRLTEAEAECANQPGTLEVTCTQPNISLSLNGSPPVTCPHTTPFPPGSVTIYATLPDFQPHTSDARIEPNNTTTIRIPTLTASTSSDPPITPPPPPTSNALLISGWTTASLGAAALITGGILYAQASSLRSEVTDAITAANGSPITSLTRTSALSKQSNADDLASYSALCFGLGATALASGTLLLTLHYLSDSPPPPNTQNPPQKTSLILSPWLDPQSLGLGLSGQF